MGQSKYIVFGDQILDEVTTLQHKEDIILPSGMSMHPGKSARQKEMERLSRSRVEEDEEDWFSNRNQRPTPTQPRNNGRDRRRERDHVRDRDRDHYRDRDRERDRDRNWDRDRDRDRDYRNDREYRHEKGRRPPSPLLAPPPIPASYPSPLDMAAGYQQVSTDPKPMLSGVKVPPSTPSLGLSIRGAAVRKEPNQFNGDSSRSGARTDRDHCGRVDDRRRDRRRDERDRYNSSRNEHGGRY
jgi:hypothetical protein